MGVFGGIDHLKDRDVDANVYSIEQFVERVLTYEFYEMTCLWLPPEFVWKDDSSRFPLMADLESRFWDEMDLDRFKARIVSNSDKVWRLGKRCFNQRENVAKGRKIIVHCFRFFLVCTQIIEHRRVTDYTAAARYTRQMEAEDMDEVTWSHYENKYWPVYKELRQRFERATPKRK